jgi:hypothetical protein
LIKYKKQARKVKTTMALSLDPTTMDAITAGFSSNLAGKQQDHQLVLKFLQADSQTQAQIIKRLASGATPQELTQVEATLKASTPGEAAARAEPHITAEAHWWGYEVFVPEKIMREFLEAKNLVATIWSLLGSVIAMPELAPVVGFVVGYIAAELMAMKAVDKGKGVELSAVWVAPVVLVPYPL